MHREVATALSFPEGYGKNLDSMNDCISDVDVPAGGGLALVFWHFDGFASHHRTVAQALLDTLAVNARLSLGVLKRAVAGSEEHDLAVERPRATFDEVS